MLIRVDAPHFVAGLVLDDGLCVQAAPILNWTVGKRWAELRVYFDRKRWIWEVRDA